MELARVLRDLWIIDGRIGVIPTPARSGVGWSVHLTAARWKAFDRLLAERTNPAILSRLFLATVDEGIGEPPWVELLAGACEVMVPMWDALLFETGLEWPDGEDGYHYARPLEQLARRAPDGLRPDHRLMMAQRLLALRLGQPFDFFAEPDEFTELAERLAGLPFALIARRPLDPALVARRDADAAILRAVFPAGDVESILPRLDAVRIQEPAAAACLAVYILRGWRVETVTGAEALAAARRFPVDGLCESGLDVSLRQKVASTPDPGLSRWLADTMPAVAFLNGIDIGRHTAEDLDDAGRIVAALLEEHPDWMPGLERALGE